MGYAYDESPFVPFNTPQVGPTVPSIPAPDMRDAEIAKLRAEMSPILDVVRRYAVAWSGKIEDVPVIIDAWTRVMDDRRDEVREVRDALFREGLARNESEKQLAAARAALKVEREACDAWRASWNTGGYESLKAAEEYHDQRRAAEAKGEME